MTVEQIYALTNTVTREILGETAILQEDLSNVVDIGSQIFGAASVDNYVKSLVNHIGRVIFVNRPYRGNAPSVLMDAWEYGSVLEKIRVELPEASENESWELEDGETYNQNVFYKPNVSAKFFNSRTTFEIPVSLTERQVKESFSNAAQLNAFLSMITESVEKGLSVRLDGLIMRTINAMTAATINADYASAALSSKSGIKAVNLLYLYNTGPNAGETALTAQQAIFTPAFIRYAAYVMGVYISRLSKLSRLFNIGGTDKFTGADFLHFIMLSDFVSAADVYLQSDTFHDVFTRLPKAEIVPYWQGSGTGYGFSDISAINVKIGETTVNATGILGVAFDRDALGVSNLNRRVTTHYNAKAEFTNNYFKADAGYFNDYNENFVVFFVA